jgi:regulatory protein
MPSAYVAALAMLARRELSEHQVRDRLGRRGFDADAVDTAVARLRAERAIDDLRAAEAIARTAATVKRRGRLRVKREIESAGIAPDVASQAVDAVFEAVDARGLLKIALARKLRSDRPIADDREFNQLYRYLADQGFETDEIVAALNARRRIGGQGRGRPDDYE